MQLVVALSSTSCEGLEVFPEAPEPGQGLLNNQAGSSRLLFTTDLPSSAAMIYTDKIGTDKIGSAPLTVPYVLTGPGHFSEVKEGLW